MTLPWQAWLTMGTVATLLVLLVRTRHPPELLFGGALTVLFVSGVLDAKDAFSGFSNPGMLTVAVLYVVVAGLKETGTLAWISNRVLGRPASLPRAQGRLMGVVIGLSAFLNNTPVVALFIPAVADWGKKLRISASKLMIPLSYAAIFGGLCTLIGTSTNLVVNGLVQSELDLPGLRMFDIAAVGVPCAVAGVLFILLASRWLLPNRISAMERLANPREYMLELMVQEDSPMIGQSVAKAGLRHLPGAFLAEIERGGERRIAIGPEEVLRAGDGLVFVGVIESILELSRQRGLTPAPKQTVQLDAPRWQRGLVEAVVSDTCPLIGKTIREGRFRNRYDAVVIAVARNGERLRGRIGDIILRSGDTLLIEAHADFARTQRDSQDFYLVSAVADSAPRRYEKAPLALVILGAMVVTAALGWLSMLGAALLAAGALLVTGCCSLEKARQSVEGHVLLVIACALAIGRALDRTGAAQWIAGGLLELAGTRPWAVLAAVYLATTLFTEIITNNAAAALVFPIATRAAAALGVSPVPFVIAIMVGASASFATPIGYQTNLMVYGPGGYRFTDFLRIGLPLNLLFGIITVTLVPFIWPF